MTYRVGNHQPQNVYRDDAYIGIMFTAEDAALVVEALNGIAHRGHNHSAGLDSYCGQQNAADSCTYSDLRLCSQGGSGRGSQLCDGSGRTCPRHGVVI